MEETKKTNNMDNYQSNNVIMQLENIAQLLKTQNELIQKLLQPQEDERTRTRKILQEAIRRAEENPIHEDFSDDRIKAMFTNELGAETVERISRDNTDTAEYIIP